MLKKLEEAIAYANSGADDMRHYRLAAIAVRADGAVVKSRNIATQQPCSQAHAEARVLKKSGYGATIYVARVLRDGYIALAKPCSKCRDLMKFRGVKRVFFTIDNFEWGCIELMEYKPRNILVLDDDKLKQRALSRILNKDNVTSARSINEFKSRVHVKSYDIIYLDYDLGPGGNGIEAVDYIINNDIKSQYIIHSSNINGGLKMFNRLIDAGYKAEQKQI